jgi:hypothetical protein
MIFIDTSECFMFLNFLQYDDDAKNCTEIRWEFIIGKKHYFILQKYLY